MGQKYLEEEGNEVLKRQCKENKIMRELGELRRVKEQIEEKKEVVELIQRIEEWQKKGVAEKFKSYREEVEVVVEHYKKKKLDYGYGNSVMETSVY
jgi:hypothetical protein